MLCLLDVLPADLNSLLKTHPKEFPGDPLVRTWHFHCQGPGTLVRELKILQAVWYHQNKKQKTKNQGPLYCNKEIQKSSSQIELEFFFSYNSPQVGSPRLMVRPHHLHNTWIPCLVQGDCFSSHRFQHMGRGEYKPCPLNGSPHICTHHVHAHRLG